MRLRFTGFFKENFGSRYYTEVSVENIHSQNKKIHPGTTFFLCLVAVFRKKKENMLHNLLCGIGIHTPPRVARAPPVVAGMMMMDLTAIAPEKARKMWGTQQQCHLLHTILMHDKENGVALGRYRRGLSSFQRKTDASLEVLSRKSAFFFFLVFSLEKNRLVRGMGGVSVT